MMPQTIPGGRPRASSDGDILNEGLCGTLFVNLNDRNCTEQPRKGPGNAGIVNVSSSGNGNNKKNSNNNVISSDETFDSDSKLSSQSQSSSRSRRKGLNLKSMRKIVSRVFVNKDLKYTDSTLNRHGKFTQAGSLYKFWMSDLKHNEEQGNTKSKSSELLHFGTLSTARPLITNSNAARILPKGKTTPGVVGIYNHGNNCFMNAVLQCLSNTDPFAEYFIRDFFRNDLKNSTNGKKGVFRSSHGEVTEQLGNFLKCLWSGKYSSEISREFKNVVGKFSSQYKGDDQHDAQEFLLWLLDCIHEDVSKFTKKKVKPLKTSVMKTDKELAAEAELANGESFILKLFQALHSSTLTCPTCGERSSTFDPYLCVSLPLPQRSLRIVYVIVVSLAFQEEKMAFTLNQYDGIRELRELVAADTRIPLKQLLLIQLKDDCFGATYSDEQPLFEIPENEAVYAVEAHPDSTAKNNSTQQFDSLTFEVLVIHVEVTSKSAHCYRFGSPAMLKVRRDITRDGLQMEILKKMEDSVCEEIFSQTEKLNTLFSLRVYDGRSRKFYIPSDVDMPLYSQCDERAFTVSNEDFTPPHIKVIAEWDPQTKSRVVVDDKEHIRISPSVAKAQNNHLGQGQVSLEECFRLYTQEEKLIGENAWLCPHCRKLQQGTIKTLRLWSLPEVLVVHLKRFKLTGRRRSKLNTLIDFPIDNLDMSDHLSHRSHSQSFKNDDYIYDLVGVSNHYGNMMGGHYTAYCRNPIDGKWREYNDTTVRTLEGPVATKEAYILFYQRRSISKSVSQRLISGNHWIYSVRMAPSEGSGKSSASGKSKNFEFEPSQQQRHSRSRSASPSSHRQNNISWKCIPIHSFTPQPVRRAMKSYISNNDLSDDSSSSTRSPSPQNDSSSHRSRPLQQQSSDFHSQLELKKPAGDSSSLGLKDLSRAHYNGGNPDLENKDFVDNNTKKPKLSTNVTRNKSGISSDGPPTKSTASEYDSSKSNDLRITTSKTISHQSSLDSGVMEPNAIDSPSSCATNVTQVKQESIDSNNSSSEFYNSTSSLSDAENAGKKLAYIIKQDIENRAHNHKAGNEYKNNVVTSDSKNLDTKNKLDSVRFKQTSTEELDVSASQISTNDAHEDSFPADTKRSNKEFQHNNRYTHSKFGHKSAGYAHSHEDGTFDSKQSQGFSERVSLHLKNDVSSPNKCATISRTYNTSQAGRFERTSIPHSNTDHSIHYSNSSLVPPPSPTPPHSLREEQTLSHTVVPPSLASSTSDYYTSSHRTGRGTHSILSCEFMGQHSSYNNPEIRTLPRRMPGSRGSRYNFHRPRDVFVKAEATPRNLTNIATPCLRESSV